MKSMTFWFASCAAILGAALVSGAAGCGGQTNSDADGGKHAGSGSGASGGGSGSASGSSTSGGSSGTAPSSGTDPSPPTKIPDVGGSDGGSGASDAGVQPCPAYGPGPRETCTLGIQCDTAPDCFCANDGKVTCDFGHACRSNADCPQPETCFISRQLFPFGACGATGSCQKTNGSSSCSGSSVKGCACDGTDVSVCLSANIDDKAVRHLGPCAETGPHWYSACPPSSGGAVGCTHGPSPAIDDAGAPCPPIGSACTTRGQTCGGSPNDPCTASEMCVDVPNCPATMGT